MSLWSNQREAEAVLETARRWYQPSKLFGLFSGGGDSSVTAHALRHELDGLMYIDTGTALPGVRDHVEETANWIGLPLMIYEARDAFDKMVVGWPEFWKAFEAELQADPVLSLQHDADKWSAVQEFVRREKQKPGKGVAPKQPLGFPGPAGHRFAYTRLKERQIDALVRDFKTGRRDRIGLVTGVRKDESDRRFRTTKKAIERRGGKVWIAPLMNWSNKEMAKYKRVHGIKVSDAAALTHRSGECNCLAFAAPGEKEMLASLWPKWVERFADLERECDRRGIPSNRWGERPPRPGQVMTGGPLCTSCITRQAEAA